VGQSFATKDTWQASVQRRRKSIVSQTVADIPTEETASSPVFFFFSLTAKGDIWKRVRTTSAWASNGRRDDCQEFNENWVNPVRACTHTHTHTYYIYIYISAQATRAPRGLLTKWIRQPSAWFDGAPSRIEIPMLRVRVACRIILNAINFLSNNKSQRLAERLSEKKLLHQESAMLTKILSRNNYELMFVR